MVLENPNITNSLYKFTVENYHKLSDSGIPPRNLELLLGGIVPKITISPFPSPFKDSCTLQEFL